jgi:hypothetical protein
VQRRDPYIYILHDGDVVEHLRKLGHVLRVVAIGVRSWEDRGRSRKVELLAHGRATELLEEREEMRGILGRNVVAADALRAGVLPVEINPVEVVVLGKVEDGLDKRGAVRGVPDVRGEPATTSPATNRHHCLHTLLLLVSARMWAGYAGRCSRSSARS